MKDLPFTRLWKLTCGAAIMLAVTGCDDSKREALKQQGAAALEQKLSEAKAKVQGLEWEKMFAEMEAGVGNVRELADLYAGHHWDEAKAWVAKVDSKPAQTVFSSIGEVLCMEEAEGVEGCVRRIDEMLKAPDLTPERKRTLEIMRSYVGGKYGQKTSDIVVLIGLIYVSTNGFTYGVNVHGFNMELDQIAFMAVIEEARAAMLARAAVSK
ncbi:MAG: hypothetical protein V4662_05205 [Verrucomicrobiota bacterium]